MSIKVAFLIDLNSLPVTSDWKEHAQGIQETVIERLYLDAKFKGKFDASEVVWAFKFYNSALTTSEAEKYGNEFWDFNKESFEIFEQQLEKEMSAICPAGHVIQTEDGSELTSLHESMIHVLSILRWKQDYRSSASASKITATQVNSKTPSNDVLAMNSDSFSNSTSNNSKSPHPHSLDTAQSEASHSRNLLYVLTKVPRDEEALQTFVGKGWKNITTSSERLCKSVVGGNGFSEIETNLKLQIKFIDAGYFWDSHSDFDNNYQFPVQNMLIRMGHVGCIVPSLKLYDHGKIGFPTWKNLLKEIVLNTTKKEVVEVFKRKPEIAQKPLSVKKPETINTTSNVISRSSSVISTRKSKVAGMDALMRGKIKTPYSHELKIEPRSKERRLKTADQYTYRKTTGLDDSFNSTSSLSMTSTSRGGRSFLSIQNPKKPILVVQSNKQPRYRDEWSSLNVNKFDVYSKSAYSNPASGATSRVTPTKRVRRNLFSSQPNEPGAKNLGFGLGSMSRSRCGSTTAIGSFSPRSSLSSNSFRSPVAGSPGGHYSPFRSPTCSRFLTSPLASRVNGSNSGSRVSTRIFDGRDGLLGSPSIKSPFAARTPSSKRRVTIDESPRKPSIMESPDGYVNVPGFHGVICPESPATPPQKRFKPSSIVSSSCEKREFVPESPECAAERYNSESFAALRNMSFYKRDEASKSQSWVAAEKKIRAARIKDSVRLSSLHSQTLSLSLEDLDFIPSPPKTTASQPRHCGTPSSPPPQTPAKMDVQGKDSPE